MQDQRLVDVCGGVVTWITNNSDRERLEEGLEALGLSDLMPKPRTPKAILHDALKAHYASKSGAGPDGKPIAGRGWNPVRPLQRKSAFTIVSEKRGTTENDYANVCYFEVSEAGQIDMDPYDSTTYWLVEKQYKIAANIMPGATLTAVLVEYLRDRLCGIALKPSGGVYWLPTKKLEPWTKLVAVVEAVGDNSVFLMRSVADTDSMRSIRHSLMDEMTRTLAEINGEISDNTLGERALDERVRRAMALKDKLTEYETLLGESLAEAKATIDATKQAAVTAKLQLAASPTAA